MSNLYARLIVNPAAGAGRTAKKLPGIMRLLKSLGLRFEHDLTEAPGHATELAAQAVEKGYKVIVSVGGDGTINEVVNGLFGNNSGGEVSLGIISTGTGSDYIRTIGIPNHPEEACRQLLSPNRLSVDLGVIDYNSRKKQKTKRFFVNFAGAGFDAEVVRATREKYKALGSTPSYLVGLLITFMFYKGKDVSLKLNGELSEHKVLSLIVSNGRYGGGKMLVAPQADPRDGWLDVIKIDDLSKPDLLRSLPRIYRGTHLTHPRVSTIRVKEIEINSREPMALQADGELLGSLPARFSIIPGALKIII